MIRRKHKLKLVFYIELKTYLNPNDVKDNLNYLISNLRQINLVDKVYPLWIEMDCDNND